MARLTLLGTGTSQGVPVIACGCEVCKSGDTRDKRLRSSAMIEVDGVRIVIDAGPDFRQQMLREEIKQIDGIMLTHEHKDHIGGIDDVRAFNHTSRGAIDIYSTPRVQKVIRKDFNYAFSEDKYPGAPEINLITIKANKPFAIEGVRVVPFEGLHHKLPVLGFRVGGLAYITDFNHIPEAAIEEIKGVEILVINALRHREHMSHFTLEQALEVSSRVGAQRTYFTHISHEMGLHAKIEQELPHNTYLAYDGLSLESDW